MADLSARQRPVVPGSTCVSDFIAEEAAIRSRYGQPATAELLARMIDAEAIKLKRLELARVEGNLGIDAAADVGSIAAILTQFGIALP